MTVMDEQTLQIIALFEREPLFMGLDDDESGILQLAFKLSIYLEYDGLHPRLTPNAFFIVLMGMWLIALA